MSVLSDTPSSRTPSPPNLPYPRSKISVVNSRVGFKFQGIEELQARNSASRLSLVRQKHLSHIDALKEDGFDFLPHDVDHALNENLTSPVTVNPRSQFPFPFQPKPRMTWKERLLASASASTLKIKGITKKLKNKVILLRDVVVPSSLNPPPPPTYHSAATPATPTPFANLPPPTKHEFSSQRIVCIRDLGLALDEEDAEKSGRLFAKEDEDGEVAPRLMSPAWPHRKHLSTLPEESDGLTSHLSDEEDDAPQPDVYVQAVLMPVENLGVPGRRGINSPARSRVSPPWMHQSLHDGSTSTLRLGAGAQQARDRPLTGSSAGDVKTPLNAAISPSSSILRFDGFRLSGEDSGLLSPHHDGRRRQSVLSFLSSTASSYGTNARRRASSLVMLPPDNHHPSHRGSRASSGRGRSSTFSAAAERDKENHGAAYATATFGKNGRTKQHQVTEHYDEDTEESDDEDEGEEQEYFVFEADPRDLDPTAPVKEGPDGKRESVLVLLPVPNSEAEAQEAGWPDMKSRWSHSDLGSGLGGDQQEVVSNPFLTPLPSGGLSGRSLPPSSSYDPSVRDSRYSRGSRRGWERDSYLTNTNTGRGAGVGGRLESAWEEEEEEGDDGLEPYPLGDNQDAATATNPFLTPAPSGYGKPLPTIPTPSENPSTWSLGSYKTAPTIPSRNHSTTHVVPPPMSRKGSSGQIPTIPGASRNPSATHLPTIPGASRNNSTTQIPTNTPRSRASSGAQPPQPSYPQNYPTPPPPYNRHQSRSRSRIHVPQTIEEPEPEELDEIDIDEDDDDDFDGELDEGQLAEIDVEEEVLPRSVGPKGSKHSLASRPGFVALPVPIPTSKPSFSGRDKLSDGRKPSKEPVAEARQRTQSKPLPPSRPESTQSPPPPAPVPVQAQVHGAPKPSKPYSSRHILSMKEFDQLEAEKAAQQPQPPVSSQQQQDRSSPKAQPQTQQQRPRQVPRPLSPLNSDIVPAPVPSPSFAPAPLAPPKSKTPKPRPVRKNSVSSTGSSRSRRAAATATRKRSGSQPKPIIVVDEEGRLAEAADEDEEGQLPNTATTIRRNRSQSNPVSPATPTRPHSSSTFGAPTSPVRTRTKTKARIPIPQALLEGEAVVDMQSPRTRVASSPANIVRSGSQKSTKARADTQRGPTRAPTRPLPPQPPTDSPRSYPRAEVVTPTPSNGSRKSRTKSSNPSTPKMTFKQGLADDGSGRAQRKEAQEWMKSSGRAFQGQACSIEVQVVDEGDMVEFGRKDGGGGYVDRSGSTRSKRSQRSRRSSGHQMYGTAAESSTTIQAIPTPKSGHVRLRPSI